MGRPAHFKKGWKFKALQDDLKRTPTAVLKDIGKLVIQQTKRAFREQALGSKIWRPRGAGKGGDYVNIYGLISDFSQSAANPPRRRFKRRPALVDTRTLQRSFVAKVRSGKVIVSTPVSYAEVHQTGGTVKSKKIDKKVRSRLYKWLKKQTKKKRKKIGWLLNKKFKNQQLEMDVPARPFLGTTRKLRQGVYKKIGGKLIEPRK